MIIKDERKEEEEVDGFNDSWAVPNVSLESESESVNQVQTYVCTRYVNTLCYLDIFKLTLKLYAWCMKQF